MLSRNHNEGVPFFFRFAGFGYDGKELGEPEAFSFLFFFYKSAIVPVYK